MTDLVTPELNKSGSPDGCCKTIFTVPSLDTHVCERQIKRLSDSFAYPADDNTVYFVVSVDTPFAQARFIKENAINPRNRFLSDYAEHRFMEQTGLRIVELNLFARAVIECDENDIVRRITVPRDITQVPL
ncbi:redoxin family protein [Citrobacter braakii]|uniref:redoxin family protein n=1 Tax=Citrobacter braakii TaxID=57706 RepID=UPI003976D085